MVDDISSDESAASPSQKHKRLSRITKTILRGGGHHRATACVVLGTIIEPDDVMDQLANPKLHPAWRATKVPMLLSFSKAHDSHWLGTYADIRNAHTRTTTTTEAQHPQTPWRTIWPIKSSMDEGATSAWEHFFIENEDIQQSAPTTV